MENKYCVQSSKLRLAVSILLLLVLQVFIVVMPFIYEDEALMYIWLEVPLAVIIFLWMLKWMFYYPEFSEYSLKLKHALFASWTREFRYSDIHCAVVSEVNDKNGTHLELAMEFLDGSKPLSVGLFLTASSQMDELKAELASHNIPDVPVVDVKNISQTIEFKNMLQIMFFIVSVVALAISLLVMFALVDVPAIFVIFFLIVIFAVAMLANYPVLDRNGLEIKNALLPFINVRIFYSDIQTVSYDESNNVLKVVRNDPAHSGKSKVCRRYLCCDGVQFYSKLKSILPQEKCL